MPPVHPESKMLWSKNVKQNGRNIFRCKGVFDSSALNPMVVRDRTLRDVYAFCNSVATPDAIKREFPHIAEESDRQMRYWEDRFKRSYGFASFYQPLIIEDNYWTPYEDITEALRVIYSVSKMDTDRANRPYEETEKYGYAFSQDDQVDAAPMCVFAQ